MVQGSLMLWPDTFSYVTSSLATTGCYERSLEDLRPLIRKTDVVLDVGAHIGYYACMFAQLVHEVIAFEPEPGNFAMLRRNLELNGYANVTARQAACSDREASIDLYLSDRCTGMHRVYPSRYCSDRTVEVEAIRIDDQVDHADIVKIDVEGHEFHVLRGMRRLLSRVRLLFFEHTPVCFTETGIDPSHVIELLENAGFSVSGKGNNRMCVRRDA